MQASNEAVFQVSTCLCLSMSIEQAPFQERLRWNCKLQDRWERGVLACDVEVLYLDSIRSDPILLPPPSSPNNFDKHASHLAVGVSQERNNKFNDMSVVFFNPLVPHTPVETVDEGSAKADLVLGSFTQSSLSGTTRSPPGLPGSMSTMTPRHFVFLQIFNQILW